MKKTIRFGAAGIAMFAAMGMSSVAHARSATADATAEVLAALELANDNELNFGTIVMNVGSTGGQVDVDTSNFRQCFGDVICGPGGAERAAGFTVTGAPNTTVIVTLEDLTTPISLTHTDNVGSTNAEHNIELTNLVDDFLGGFGFFSGSESFNVGGTISLDGSEIPGTYEGSFEVSVAYQ